VQKDDHISADVEWFADVKGDVRQVVIHVQCILVVVEATGGLTAAAVSTRPNVIDAEETEVDKTTEEDQYRQEVDTKIGTESTQSKTTVDKTL